MNHIEVFFTTARRQIESAAISPQRGTEIILLVFFVTILVFVMREGKS